MSNKSNIFTVGSTPIAAKLCRLANIKKVINKAVDYDSAKTGVSPGTVIESMVINILCDNQPLYRIEDYWEDQDLNLLFGEDNLTSSQLNEFAYGRALDKLSKVEQKELVSNICLNMAKAHDIDIKQIHCDTTSISVQGAHESDEAQPFITYGHSKDHRPDLKQFKIGAAVTPNGLPVMGELLPGNKADQKWNVEAITSMNQYFDSHEYKDVIFVGDSATVQSEENIKQLKGIRYISRFPEQFSLAKEIKQSAFEDDHGWIYLNKSCETTTSNKEFVYKVKQFNRQIAEQTLRFIVVESKHLESSKEKSLTRQINRKKKAINKIIKEACKTSFACEKDAQTVANNLMETILKAGFEADYKIVEEQKKSYARRGRPSKDASGVVTISYHIQATLGEVSKEVYEELLKNEKTFILITSLLDQNEYTMGKILSEYKHQNSVELSFRFLKDPVYLGRIYLKNQERIKALGYVFIMVLLVASYLQHRIRESLEERGEILVVSKAVKHKRPTVKSILEPIKNTIILIENGERRLNPNTRKTEVLLRILDLLGFDKEIYLKYIP